MYVGSTGCKIDDSSICVFGDANLHLLQLALNRLICALSGHSGDIEFRFLLHFKIVTRNCSFTIRLWVQVCKLQFQISYKPKVASVVSEQNAIDKIWLTNTLKSPQFYSWFLTHRLVVVDLMDSNPEPSQESKVITCMTSSWAFSPSEMSVTETP